MKKLNLSLFSLLIFLLFSIVSHSSEKIILGNAKVIDGDTIKINDNKIDNKTPTILPNKSLNWNDLFGITKCKTSRIIELNIR